MTRLSTKKKLLHLGHNMKAVLDVCSSTDFRKVSSSYSWAATVDHFICSETFVWNLNNNLVLCGCVESLFLLMMHL